MVKDFLLALVPSLGVLLFFYLTIKSLIEADRRERTAIAKLDRERAAAQSGPTGSAGDSDRPGSSIG